MQETGEVTGMAPTWTLCATDGRELLTGIGELDGRISHNEKQSSEQALRFLLSVAASARRQLKMRW